MNKINLLKLLFIQQKYKEKGISLMELLVAIILGSIVLTAATSGFVNLLRLNQSVETKTTRSVALTRALTFLQQDIQNARAVTRTSCTGVTSTNCLLLTYPTGSRLVDTNGDGVINNNDNVCSIPNPYILYGYEDIKTGTQIYLKPGVLKRQLSCITVGNWQVVADGLVSVDQNNPNPACNQDLGTKWTGATTVYGDNGSGKGGFRFCLDFDDTDPTITTPNNRLVRVFLYGHIIGGDNKGTVSVNTIGFARTN